MNSLLTGEDERIKKIIADRTLNRITRRGMKKTPHEGCIKKGVLRGLYYNAEGINYKRLQSLSVCNKCGKIIETVQKQTSFKANVGEE